MLPRSSSFTSTDTESIQINVKSTSNAVFRHHESLQNLRPTRPMLSRQLNIENNNQQNVKRVATGTTLLPTHNLPINEKKSELQVETIKRIAVQDDIENIQERLNEMLIVAPTATNETLLLPAEQASTTEYFTPKISIDDSGRKKGDEQDSRLIHEENSSDDDEDDLYRE